MLGFPCIGVRSPSVCISVTAKAPPLMCCAMHSLFFIFIILKQGPAQPSRWWRGERHEMFGETQGDVHESVGVKGYQTCIRWPDSKWEDWATWNQTLFCSNWCPLLQQQWVETELTHMEHQAPWLALGNNRSTSGNQHWLSKKCFGGKETCYATSPTVTWAGALWPHLSAKSNNTHAVYSWAAGQGNTSVEVPCKRYTSKQKTAWVSQSPTCQACFAELEILRGHRIGSIEKHWGRITMIRLLVFNHNALNQFVLKTSK